VLIKNPHPEQCGFFLYTDFVYICFNMEQNIPEGFYKDKSGNILKRECTCGKTNQEMEDCKLCKPQIFGMTGWICPVCGRGNSPFSSSCPCVPFPGFQITCGDINQPKV
jgi:hypothetical protein